VGSQLRAAIADAPVDAVRTIRVVGAVADGARHVLTAANIRALAPATMNVDLVLEDGDRAALRSRPAARQGDAVLELPF
jgi:hypothetical protein